MNWIDLLTIAAYLSLALELLCIPVPSVASSYHLVYRPRADSGVVPESAAPTATATSSARWLRFFGPAALNVAVFMLPLVSALSPLPLSLWERWNTAPPAILVTIGCLALLIGRALTIRAALDMRRLQRQPPAQGSLDQPLQTGGLFRYSRNPGLCGMYLFAAGLLLLYPSELFAIGLVHYLWHMHRRVLIEESVLRRQFTDRYAAYCAQTPRYF